jgi:1,2-diacylglycerol 3-alpha-glucosyltransferase
MNRPLTVALVMAAPFPALQGSQVLVRQLADGLARRGHRVHLVAYGTASNAVPPGVVAHRIPQLWGYRITASGPHPAKIVLDTLLTAKLLSVVRREHVDVLHAHNYEGALASLVVRGLTNRPVVYHGHSAMAAELPTYFANALARRAAGRVGRWLDANVPPRADYCIGVTSELVDVLRARGVGADEVRCVFPGAPELDVEAADGSRPVSMHELGGGRGPILLYAGNLDGYQNLDFLLRSFARVHTVRPDARLLVVTHGEGRRYRRQADALCHDAVRIITVRSFPEARMLIDAADAVVCPRTEATGFPIKLLNYMAAGKAIIACAGSAKLLEDGDTGLVVPNGDEAAFAAAMLRLLEDPIERQRLGMRARDVIRTRYGSQAMLNRIEAIYERVVERYRRVGGPETVVVAPSPGSEGSPSADTVSS